MQNVSSLFFNLWRQAAGHCVMLCQGFELKSNKRLFTQGVTTSALV